ncbi:MAG: dTDP-4-dehydrorhamnose reductase [Candidatus Zixiibacteriota bacterium]|nr:MAG: dTDP-4-dehydrorhamnose reductase [candidate division Zixibacteria bacterium]
MSSLWYFNGIPMAADDLLHHFVPYGRRLLITGCHGLLGRKLHALLAPANIVAGVDLAPQSALSGDRFTYYSLDLTQREPVAAVVEEFHPSFILNTAAMTDVDGCEMDKDRCWRLNVLAVENLIRAAKKSNAHLIHLSSDYVFDGRHPPYRETDPTAPLGFYGKSKLAGENALRGAGLPHTIVRTQVLYGVAPDIRSNFVSFVLDKLRQPGELRIVDDQRGTPTLADDLAEGIGRLIQLQREGIYHISGRDSVSRWEFAREIARQFGEDPERILPLKTADLKQNSPRPADSSFSLEKIRRDLSFLPRGIREGLQEYRLQREQLQTTHGGETR